MNTSGRLALILFLTAVAAISNAQQSLIGLEDLDFRSDYEQHLFQKVQSGTVDYFDLLMVMPEVDSAQVSKWSQTFDLRVQQLKQEKKPKKADKYVKMVYEFVHDAFLRKYEDVAYFDQLFENGVYNCVTAVGLYGLVFDELGISYEIKETPTHVYIVAMADTEQIGIETTDPVHGYKTFSPGFKQYFVNQLVSVKLIDASEVNQGVDVVFNRYYFTDTHLGLKELAGLQYYNNALGYFNEQDYEQSFASFKKAYYLHPTEEIKELLLAAALLATSKLTYESDRDVDLLIFIANAEHGDVGASEVLGEFGRLLNKQLIEKNDTALLANSFNKLKLGLKDTATISQIEFYYQYERARRLYNNGQYVDAFPFAKAALSAQPSNSDAQLLVVGTFNNAVVSKVWESSEYLQIIEQLYEQYPILTDNLRLGSLRGEIYLEAMHDSYMEGKVTVADKYQSMFEHFMDAHEGVTVNDWSIGRAYSRGITYYFKKGWYKSARKILNAGLKYSPDNQELKLRKYYLDQAQF